MGRKIMKKNILKKAIAIMLIFIAMEVCYLIGFYTENKISYGNSEEEISAEVSDEIVDEISNENLEIETEIPISDADLTEETDDDIIIVDDESDMDSEPTLEDILINECPFSVIDEIDEIDSYEEGCWYCYYIYADGDVYVVTTKNNHVDICVQLN
jgi:hypothetical protein